MKKILCFLFMPVIFLCFSCKKEGDEVLRKGIINFTQGNVILIINDSLIPAAAGAEVKEGTVVKTGEDSFVDIYFGLNVIKVLENSEVEISVLRENIREEFEKTRFTLREGGLFSSIRKKLTEKDEYRLVTPTTIAAVRGTEFLLEELNNMTSVFCSSGVVRVRGVEDPEERAVDVEGGFGTTVQKGFVGDVRELSSENMRNIQSIIDDISDMRADIREKFEDDRDRIRQDVIDRRESNRENIENQREMDRENIKKIKGELTDRRDVFSEDVESLRQEVPRFDSGIKKEDSSVVKPEIKRFGRENE